MFPLMYLWLGKVLVFRSVYTATNNNGLRGCFFACSYSAAEVCVSGASVYIFEQIDGRRVCVCVVQWMVCSESAAL